MHGLIEGWLLAVFICGVLGFVFGLLVFVLLQPMDFPVRLIAAVVAFLLAAAGIQYILKAPSEPTH